MILATQPDDQSEYVYSSRGKCKNQTALSKLGLEPKKKQPPSGQNTKRYKSNDRPSAQAHLRSDDNNLMKMLVNSNAISTEKISTFSQSPSRNDYYQFQSTRSYFSK